MKEKNVIIYIILYLYFILYYTYTLYLSLHTTTFYLYILSVITRTDNEEKAINFIFETRNQSTIC